MIENYKTLQELNAVQENNLEKTENCNELIMLKILRKDFLLLFNFNVAVRNSVNIEEAEQKKTKTKKSFDV